MSCLSYFLLSSALETQPWHSSMVCYNDHYNNNKSYVTIILISCIQQVQKTIPFHYFDPTNVRAETAYISPKVRVAKSNGGMFAGVYDIYLRGDENEREGQYKDQQRRGMRMRKILDETDEG